MYERHGLCHTLAYKSWEHMKHRCNTTTCKAYPNYGGRGIQVCTHWNEFLNFWDDMGERKKGQTLERIDTNDHYCKVNCIWLPKTLQSRNQRSNIFLEFNGKKQLMSDWSRELGISKSTLHHRHVKLKLPVEEVLSTIRRR